MADGVSPVGKDGGYDFLFGNSIPYKHEMHVFAYHIPGIVCAVAIGILTNMLLEEVLKKISKKVAEHSLVTLTWISLIIYLIFFTNFDLWVAQKVQWYRVCSYPYARAK